MELGATMELRVGRGSQLGEEDTPLYSGVTNPTVIHLTNPRLAVLPHQPSGTTARAHGTTTADRGTTAAMAGASPGLNRKG